MVFIWFYMVFKDSKAYLSFEKKKKKKVSEIWLLVKNTGYLKNPGLVKGKMSPRTCGPPQGWHLFDP